jgi:hypothetical protein
MRNFNVLAALSAALLMAGGVSAKEKSDQPKPRKICRSVQEPGRITPKRICRVAPPSASSGENGPSKSANPTQPGKGRD